MHRYFLHNCAQKKWCNQVWKIPYFLARIFWIMSWDMSQLIIQFFLGLKCSPNNCDPTTRRLHSAVNPLSLCPLGKCLCPWVHHWHWGKSQYFIQLVYKPHFETWSLLFGQFGHLRAVRKNDQFEFFVANFVGGFFNFQRAKKSIFFFQGIRLSTVVSTSCLT